MREGWVPKVVTQHFPTLLIAKVESAHVIAVRRVLIDHLSERVPMKNVMKSPNLNSVAEYNEFHYLLLGDLRDLLEEIPDESTRHWLLEVLNVLVELQPQERQLQEDDGGYMSEVLEEFPSWNRQVMRLHLRKLQLDYRLRELRDRIRQEKSYVSVADQLSCELRDWLDLIRELHRAESALIMDAMLLDIGTGD